MGIDSFGPQMNIERNINFSDSIITIVNVIFAIHHIVIPKIVVWDIDDIYNLTIITRLAIFILLEIFLFSFLGYILSIIINNIEKYYFLLCVVCIAVTATTFFNVEIFLTGGNIDF